MLGILLIWFIGKQFYELAGKHGKNQWVFAVLGVVSYYAGTFVAGLFIGVVLKVWENDSIASIPEIALGLIALPFGLLACWGTYKLLQNQWQKIAVKADSNILDSELMP